MDQSAGLGFWLLNAAVFGLLGWLFFTGRRYERVLGACLLAAATACVLAGAWVAAT